MYKIVGPDNISQTVMKGLLTEDFAIPSDALKHADSQRPLSTLQLVALLEEKLRCPAIYTGPIRALAKLRVTADHKVLEPESETRSYSREFAGMCNELSQALEQLANLLTGRAK